MECWYLKQDAVCFSARLGAFCIYVLQGRRIDFHEVIDSKLNALRLFLGYENKDMILLLTCCVRRY